jgi:hypothetical protein
MYKDRSRKKSKVIASRFTPREAELLSSMAKKYVISESKLINFLCFVPPATMKSEYLTSLMKEHLKNPLELLKTAEEGNVSQGKADET